MGRRQDLDDAAALHHGQPVAHMGDHRQVVADHQIGQPVFVAQIGQQVQDLGLDADVQRAGRLVQQQQARLRSQGAGDRHALPLSPGQLVRIAKAEPPAQAHVVQQLDDALVDPVHALQAQGFRQDGIDGMARMQAGIGVLEHHLDGAKERPVALLSLLDLTVDRDVAGPAGDQTCDGAQDGRLARTAFADQAKAFALRHVEGRIVDGGDAVGLLPEPDGQIGNAQHLRGLSRRGRASCPGAGGPTGATPARPAAAGCPEARGYRGAAPGAGRGRAASRPRGRHT